MARPTAQAAAIGRLMDELRARDADECGDAMPGDDRPRLRKLAVRDAKEQHCARSHGGDEGRCIACREHPCGKGDERQDGKSAAYG